MDKTELKVLLIEDDSSIAGLIKYYLKDYRDYSFRVDWVDSAESGIEKISNSGDYEIVILDYYLPGLNGVEALKILKARGINVPVMVLTRAKENEIAAEILKLGAVDYYVKEDVIGPLFPVLIVSIVERENLKREIEKNKDERSQKIEAIQELVITVSHEVNNPLAAIKLATNILLKKDLPVDIKTYIKIIKENVDRIEQTILRLRELKSEQIVPYVGRLRMFDISSGREKREE